MYLPRSIGRAALEELPQVRWDTLAHAYGVGGRRGVELDYDVEGSLRALGSQPDEALGSLYSNICHQGTTYEASAHAIPFLAAFAADAALAIELRAAALALTGSIVRAATRPTTIGSHAGAFGPTVAPLTHVAVWASRGWFLAIAGQNPVFANLVEGIFAAATDQPDDAIVIALGEAIDRVERIAASLW